MHIASALSLERNQHMTSIPQANSIPQADTPQQKPLRIFENPALSAGTLRDVLSLCGHFQGRNFAVCTSGTETIAEAQEYAASMINPEGKPDIWFVQVGTDTGEMQTLAVGGNGKNAEATARFIAIAATVLPEMLPALLALAESEAQADAQQADIQEASHVD